MDSSTDALTRLVNDSKTEARKKEAYELACGHVPFGSLNSHDVLRLFGDPTTETQSGDIGTRARQLVTKMALPLLELAPGQYVVAHTVTIPGDTK